MANTKKTDVTEIMGTAMELTQSSAQTVLKGAVQTAEVTENYVQGMYKAGYDANYEALKVAKNYWDATSQIRQDWIKLFGQAGESLINATAKMELPMQKEIMDMGKNVVGNIEKVVGDLTPQSKTAAK